MVPATAALSHGALSPLSMPDLPTLTPIQGQKEEQIRARLNKGSQNQGQTLSRALCPQSSKVSLEMRSEEVSPAFAPEISLAQLSQIKLKNKQTSRVVVAHL